MIDTSAASPDKSILLGKPTSPSIIDFKYESRFDIESVDDIWQRVEFSYYHSLSDLQRDFEILFSKVLQFRCLNTLSKVYLTQVYTKSIALIKSKKEEFKEKWRVLYDSRFQNNENSYPMVHGSWYKAAGPKRDYNIIQNYKILTPQGANPKTA